MSCRQAGAMREHEKGPMIRVGRALDQAMASYGLKIISKTKHLHKGNRSAGSKRLDARETHPVFSGFLMDTDYEWEEYRPGRTLGPHKFDGRRAYQRAGRKGGGGEWNNAG